MDKQPSGPDFEISPPPITSDRIKEAFSTDVIVIGAGISGLTAAASAAEAGARVVLLEKGPTFHQRGLHNAALSSRLQKKAGIKVDKDNVIYTIMEFATYRNDQRIVKLWADNCDRVMDWLLDMADASGIEVIIDPTTKPWYFPNYPVIHVFRPKRQETLALMLQDYAQSHGADIRFETPAVRLIREGKGRVSGVIAQSASGDFLKFNALKGVILCTGDYGNDIEMVKKYCRPAVHNLKVVYEPVVNTGDGHKMGMWVGAAMDDIPHCAMVWDFATFCGPNLFNLARQPWLYVNIEGERFMNEDLPYGYECNQMLLQPGNYVWAVWDAKYSSEWPKMQSQCCKNMGPPTFLWSEKQLEDALDEGKMLKEATIDELARNMDVPAAAFKATVSRYNELARRGHDDDYGKHPDRLTTLEKPPFYACKIEARRMVTLSGLKINTRLQVLDKERKPIPGLYAAGNVSGSFFGDSYPTTVPGLTHSRAWTFGRLAGLNAAAEKAYGR
jgi:fumarate reductase flavoprotein subunit